MDQNRLNWIDVSRGIAMLMVIYSHLFYCSNIVMNYLSPIFLTTFFFISGYLQKDNYNFIDLLERRTRTILIPFFFWGIILLIMRHIITFNETITWQEDLYGLLAQVRGKNDQLWFLPAIWVFSLIFYWINKFAKNEKQLIIISFLLFISNCIYLYWFHGKMFYWHLTLIGTGCFYMTLGKIYKTYEKKIDEKISAKQLLIIGIIYIIYITYTNKYYSYFGSKYILDSIFITILGLILCVYISKYLLSNKRIIISKYLIYIGSNTLLYFIFHGKIISITQFLFSKIHNYINLENFYIEQTIRNINYYNNCYHCCYSYFHSPKIYA